MKIYYDGKEKKASVEFTKFDKIINTLLILAICATCVWCIAKPDLSNFKIVFPVREVQPERVYSEGTQVDWSEYKSLIGNKKALKEYKSIKSNVVGYISNISTKKNSGDYIYLVLNPSENDTSVFIAIKITDNRSNRETLSSFKPGWYSIVAVTSFENDGDKGLLCYNPVINQISAEDIE